MNFLVFAVFIILEKLVPIFPPGFLYFIIRIKSKFFYYLVPIRRKTARMNLKMAFPDKNTGEINNIIKDCYLNVLIVITEFFYMRKYSEAAKQDKMIVTNIDEVNGALKSNRGVILVCAHFGNWELAAYITGQLLSVPFNVIVKEQSNRLIDKRVNMIRESAGNKMIEMKRAARGVFRAISRNEAVAMLGDQSAPAESVSINFFGREITAFEGPAVFALRTKAPLFWAVPVRNNDYSYTLTFIRIDTSKYDGNKSDSVQKLTQELMALLEEHIKLYPDHWLWFHRRFKSVIDYD